MSARTILEKFADVKQGTLLKKLFDVPTKDKIHPKLFVSKKGCIYQADLLTLPTDPATGYNMLLVVVDIFDGTTDAEPLRTKTSKSRDGQEGEVIKAFKTIFSRGILEFPKTMIETDQGSEFISNAFRNYFQSRGVIIKYGEVGRHKQQGLVESRNGLIGKALFQRMYASFLASHGEINDQWSEHIRDLINDINEVYAKRKKVKPKDVDFDKFKNDEILDVGTHVRVKLEEPQEITGEKIGVAKSKSGFRKTDIRWDYAHPRIIKKIIMSPTTGIRYLLDGQNGLLGVSNASYLRNELQVIDENEKLPPKSMIHKPVDELNEYGDSRDLDYEPSPPKKKVTKKRILKD
jgi:hypothetical protein